MTQKAHKCFGSISIINRDGDILYEDGGLHHDLSDILKKELNIPNWDSKYPMYEKLFIQEKIKILETTLGQNTLRDVNQDKNNIDLKNEKLGYDKESVYEWNDIER